jgi:hypothetical protein
VGSQRGGVLLVTGPRGLVRLVHGHARVGTRVDVRSGRVLHVYGLAKGARIRGIVVRRTNGDTFLSVAGRMLVIHRGGRHLSSASSDGINPGDVVSALVSFATGGGLAEQEVEDLGHEDGATVQATITAVGAGSVTISVGTQSLTIPLPSGVTIPDTAVGTQFPLKLDFSGDNPTAEPEDDQTSGEGDHGSPNSGPGSTSSGPGDQGDQGQSGDDDQAGETEPGDDGDQGDQGGQGGDDQSGDDQSGDQQDQSGGSDDSGGDHHGGGSGGSGDGGSGSGGSGDGGGHD